MKKAQRNVRLSQPVTHTTLSPGPTVVLDGKTWRIGFNTQDAKARLEELMRSHVVREALKNKRAVGGPDGEELFAAKMKQVEGGHYLSFAEGWRDLLRTPVGGTLYLLSLLQEHHPDATESDARRLLVQESEQTTAALTAITPDFLAAAAVQMGVNPGDAPGLVAAVVADLAAKATTAEPGTGFTPSP